MFKIPAMSKKNILQCSIGTSFSGFSKATEQLWVRVWQHVHSAKIVKISDDTGVIRESDKVADKQSNSLDIEFDRVMGLLSCTMALFQKPQNQNPSLWKPEGRFVDESISAVFLPWPCCEYRNPVARHLGNWFLMASMAMPSGQGSHN